MSDVRLSGRLPGEETNGLEAVFESEFLKVEKPNSVVIVAVVERTKRTVADADGAVTAQASVVQVEPVSDDARESALGLLAAAYKARTGNEQLDFDALDAEDDDERDTEWPVLGGFAGDVA